MSTPPAFDTFETRELLNGRYQILQSLGTGGQGHTMLAADQPTNTRVAIKKFSLRAAENWKALELVEREAAVLRSLSHPGIPKFIDSFELSAAGTEFYLVQEYIEGQTLRALLKQGKIWKENEAHQFLAAMLDILEYLHGFSPPIVHRDLKPDNIIRRHDGTLVLVDFGAVQHILHDTIGGSTMVGTSGYLPPEQLMGRAVPASDLYALGATLVELCSGIHPANLPVDRMRLNFEGLFKATPPFQRLLKQLLEPHLEERFDSVQAVHHTLRKSRALEKQTFIVQPDAVVLHDFSKSCPVYNPLSKIKLTDQGLLIIAPSKMSLNDKISAIFLSFLALLFILIEAGSNPSIFMLFLIVAIAVFAILYSYILQAWADYEITFTPQSYHIKSTLFGQTRIQQDSLDNLYRVYFENLKSQSDTEEATLQLSTKSGKIHLLESASPDEKKWAANLIQQYLRNVREQPALPVQPAQELKNHDTGW